MKTLMDIFKKKPAKCKKCGHLQDHHLQGDDHCFEVLYKIPYKTSVLGMSKELYIQKLCECKKFEA